MANLSNAIKLFGKQNKLSEYDLVKKREAITQILLDNLKAEHDQKVQKIKSSKKFNDFKENIIENDPTYLLLEKLREQEKSIIENLEEFYASKVDLEVDGAWVNRPYYLDEYFNYGKSLGTRHPNDYLQCRTADEFPEAFEPFDRWKLERKIDNWLELYDVTDADKVINSIMEKLNA